MKAGPGFRCPSLGEEPPSAAPERPRGIRRRDLLVWGGAAALLPGLPGVARAQAAAIPPPRRGMSVGFVEGSDAWRSLRKVNVATLARGHRDRPGERASVHTVVPAVEMLAGDQTLASELVRVGVRGLYPVAVSDRVARVRLTVFYPSPNPDRRPIPFHAWSYESLPAPSPSPPLEFVAPLGIDGSLQMRLEVTQAPRRELSRRALTELSQVPLGGDFAADFTVDWFQGRPKLQRGVYLLGLSESTWASAQELPVHKSGRQRPLHLLSLVLTFDPVAER